MPHNNSDSDNTIITGLKDRDEKFLELLIRNYSNILKTAPMRILGSLFTPEHAEEILSDTFVRVWNTIDTYDSSKASLRSWMFTIALFESYTVRKKLLREEQIRNKLSALDQDVYDDIAMSHIDKRWNSINNAVTDLKAVREEYAKIITLRFIYGLGYEDIGRRLNISAAAARVKVFRAIQRLRALLAEGDLREK